MPNLLSRQQLRERIASTFADPSLIQAALRDVTLPRDVQSWLSRLKALYGVPIHYLVPDEHMLPPESIRFFYVDMNWVDALIDGAFSIGRNLTQSTEEKQPSRLNVDKAVSPALHAQASAGVAYLRAMAFGVNPPMVSLKVVSGFLLRSDVVVSSSGMGVYAFDGTGGPLTLIRYERLGPTADTVICLVDGDLARADIHEPPESLHYGIDQYAATGGSIQAKKEVRTFKTDGDGNVALNPPQSEQIGTYFRKSAPRTLRISSLSGFIGGLSGLKQLDSAQMGFEMTQGVGLVSFVKRTS